MYNCNGSGSNNNVSNMAITITTSTTSTFNWKQNQYSFNNRKKNREKIIFFYNTQLWPQTQYPAQSFETCASCLGANTHRTSYTIHQTPYTIQTVRRHFICKYSNILVTAIKITLFVSFFFLYVALLFFCWLCCVSHLWFRHQVAEWVSAIKCQIFNRLWNYRYKPKLCLSSSTSSSSNQTGKALNHGVILCLQFFPSFFYCFQIQQFFINVNTEYAFFPFILFFFFSVNLLTTLSIYWFLGLQMQLHAQQRLLWIEFCLVSSLTKFCLMIIWFFLKLIGTK